MMTLHVTDTFRIRRGKVTLKPGWKPIVTHHAIIRYAERAMGLNIEAIKEAMSTEMVRKAIVLGAGYVRCGSVKLVIEQGKVVTVLGSHMRPKNASILKSKRAERLALEAL